MPDVEIVIKMPEEEYNKIKENDFGLFGGRFFQMIRNATLLPKGHERLIAEPTEEEIKKTVGGLSDFAEYGRDCVKAVLDNAPTIIEADKEKKDADSD